MLTGYSSEKVLDQADYLSVSLRRERIRASGGTPGQLVLLGARPKSLGESCNYLRCSCESVYCYTLGSLDLASLSLGLSALEAHSHLVLQRSPASGGVFFRHKFRHRKRNRRFILVLFCMDCLKKLTYFDRI